MRTCTYTYVVAACVRTRRHASLCNSIECGGVALGRLYARGGIVCAKYYIRDTAGAAAAAAAGIIRFFYVAQHAPHERAGFQLNVRVCATPH